MKNSNPKPVKVGSLIEFAVPAGRSINWRTGTTEQHYTKVRAKVFIINPDGSVVAAKNKGNPYVTSDYKVIRA